MSHRLIAVLPNLLHEIVDFFKPFNTIFDHIKMSTIQNIIPTYYLIQQLISSSEESAFNCIQLLRQYVQEGLDNKYWSSTTMIHQLATVLDSTFRQLSFIEDASFRRGVIDNVKNSLQTLSSYIEVNACEMELIPPKVSKSDPFLSLRSSASVSAKLTTTCEIKESLIQEFNSYLGNSAKDTTINPLMFRKVRQSEYPCLSQLAHKIYLIPASSGESDRHFSISGATLDSKRSNLAGSTVESLVVLKESTLNGLWP
ncbi:hypothetical protein LOD99_10466 [Oopsacas minuta]|uniref:HAT C-terminal dimerisation domain-containing protein n=1 Tax=Oopsacas minuta TaxID=111878 RepID=A0AAV7KH73_9METZ|nr:hypothetical protein LOD99_10466 [Oopsacas minuta]